MIINLRGRLCQVCLHLSIPTVRCVVAGPGLPKLQERGSFELQGCGLPELKGTRVGC